MERLNQERLLKTLLHLNEDGQKNAPLASKGRRSGESYIVRVAGKEAVSTINIRVQGEQVYLRV